MKSTDQEKLIDYLYEEADAESKESICAQLAGSEEVRQQLADWKRTMACLDAWSLEEEGTFRCRRILSHFVAPLLKIAAVIVVVLALGFLLGRQSERSDERLAHLERDLENRLESRLAQQFELQRQAWVAEREELEKELLLASGSEVHEEAQAVAERALQQLARNELRNELLVLLLPPEEQIAYREKKASREALARAARNEAARAQALVQQIVARAGRRNASRLH